MIFYTAKATAVGGREGEAFTDDGKVKLSLALPRTLGGSGKQGGDRHPKIRRGVMIGAGAKVLGNIEVGEDARIAAGSVVLENVPPRCTVAGVPARPVGGPCCDGVTPAQEMDQRIE